MQQAVAHILSEAGWFVEREVEISHYVEFLKNDDYVIFERAVQVLKVRMAMCKRFLRAMDSVMNYNQVVGRMLKVRSKE